MGTDCGVDRGLETLTRMPTICQPRSTSPLSPALQSQLTEAISCMGNAKDMVALSLAHKCDELESELVPFRVSLANTSALTIGDAQNAYSREE